MFRLIHKIFKLLSLTIGLGQTWWEKMKMQTSKKSTKVRKDNIALQFLKIIFSGIQAIGQGMEKQHDEQLMTKTKPSKG